MKTPATILDHTAKILWPVAALGMAVASWGTFRLLPNWEWSSCRLAASVRLAYGLPLYTPPGGAVMNDWVYGPVAPIAYLPAAAAADPLGAIQIAAVLNAIYFLLPSALIFFGLTRRDAPRWLAPAGFVFCVGALFLPPSLQQGAAGLQVDTVAICLGVLSCVTLVRGGRLLLAAGLCALAIWTKQLVLPLAVAQLIFLRHLQGARAMWRYAGWLSVTGAATTAIFFTWFGPATLWLSLVRVLSRFPFEFHRLGSEFRTLAPPIWWLLPVAIAAWKWAPVRPKADDDPDIRLGWLLFLVAAFLLPGGMVAMLKNGGGQNSLHSIAYAVLGAAIFGVTLARSAAPRVAQTARWALLGGMLIVTALNLTRVITFGHLRTAPFGEQHREAFEFAKAHPGQAFFPWNPLATLMAERRDYPTESGYHDWLVAGEAPPPAEIRRVFPSTLTYVIYFGQDQHSLDMLTVFPEFTQWRFVGTWFVCTRPTGTSEPAPTGSSR